MRGPGPRAASEIRFVVRVTPELNVSDTGVEYDGAVSLETEDSCQERPLGPKLAEKGGIVKGGS